jgi:hypothetical protein
MDVSSGLRAEADAGEPPSHGVPKPSSRARSAARVRRGRAGVRRCRGGFEDSGHAGGAVAWSPDSERDRRWIRDERSGSSRDAQGLRSSSSGVCRAPSAPRARIASGKAGLPVWRDRRVMGGAFRVREEGTGARSARAVLTSGDRRPTRAGGALRSADQTSWNPSLPRYLHPGLGRAVEEDSEMFRDGQRRETSSAVPFDAPRAEHERARRSRQAHPTRAARGGNGGSRRELRARLGRLRQRRGLGH